MDSARYDITHIFIPRFLSLMARYDAASTICQVPSAGFRIMREIAPWEDALDAPPVGPGGCCPPCQGCSLTQ